MIQKESPKAKIVLLEIDLGSFASIKRFCSDYLSVNWPLHILINNAGKLSNKLEFSEDKFEMTFATNYLGHFLLTELLLEKMVETAAQTGIQGRIVNASSVGHRSVDRDDFNFNQMLQPKKRANVTINAVHPGTVKTGIIGGHKGFLTDTKCLFISFSELVPTNNSAYLQHLFSDELPTFGRVTNNCSQWYKGRFFVLFLANFSNRQLSDICDFRFELKSASTTCYVALSPKIEGVSGSYFVDCNESQCASLANDESKAFQLWNLTRAL
ncbi:hypothetical protein RJ640_030208 [Escallonia rubra]|uniref:Short-chain dehydrogenase TIC 32, chloroplastic n=1 Tax=Escallonia rubra TaxID=112253 RepID=A0AA88ULK1_9ASTE|nr:hypothetical protein RJ640_030208 [Escallonia rubra]